MKIINVVGARPNFVKIAPIIKEMEKNKEIEHILVHTGQHYDFKMSDVFFQDLDIPKPDINLEVGSGSSAEQTGKIMERFEKVLIKERPELVVVVGDCNSTLACALSAAYLHIPVAHVEAGLRSFNLSMPEEVNRILTDRISSLLFTTEKSANKNLRKEGVSEEKIFFVGNVMIDSIVKNMEKIDSSNITKRIGLKEKDYSVLTLHRPSNVDNKERLQSILKSIEKIQERIKVVWPVHPRTEKMMERFGITPDYPNIIITKPLGYIEFLSLVKKSKFVMTDSGGIQEETTFLAIPCLTLRNETERPITVERGTNIIIGDSPQRLVEESFKILDGYLKSGVIPELWDGKTAKRIVNTIKNIDINSLPYI